MESMTTASCRCAMGGGRLLSFKQTSPVGAVRFYVQDGQAGTTASMATTANTAVCGVSSSANCRD